VDILLKQRLVGAIVLISLAVIFLPMLFTGSGEQEQKFESSIPAEPVYEIKSPQVSVPLPLPSKTPEPVALREPVAQDPPAEAEAKPKEAPTPTNTAKADAEKPQPPAAEDGKPEPKAKTPAAMPIKAASEIKSSDVTGWVVQVGSFSQKANAEKLRDKLRKLDMASFVVTGISDNKTVYRVRVGPEINRADAEKIQAKIKEKTKLNGLVMKYP